MKVGLPTQNNQKTKKTKPKRSKNKLIWKTSSKTIVFSQIKNVIEFIFSTKKNWRTGQL